MSSPTDDFFDPSSQVDTPYNLFEGSSSSDVERKRPREESPPLFSRAKHGRFDSPPQSPQDDPMEGMVSDDDLPLRRRRRRRPVNIPFIEIESEDDEPLIRQRNRRRRVRRQLRNAAPLPYQINQLDPRYVPHATATGYLYSVPPNLQRHRYPPADNTRSNQSYRLDAVTRAYRGRKLPSQLYPYGHFRLANGRFASPADMPPI